MKINDFKNYLYELENVTFMLPNNEKIPPHFHITEMGIIDKHYIDCGGTIRKEKTANFQIWHANDYEHRIDPKKIIDIIEVAQKAVQMENLDIEVEYQSETIGKYELSFSDDCFQLVPTFTDCLAKDKCGIPSQTEINESNESCCSPTSGCC